MTLPVISAVSLPEILLPQCSSSTSWLWRAPGGTGLNSVINELLRWPVLLKLTGVQMLSLPLILSAGTWKVLWFFSVLIRKVICNMTNALLNWINGLSWLPSILALTEPAGDAIYRVCVSPATSGSPSSSHSPCSQALCLGCKNLHPHQVHLVFILDLLLMNLSSPSVDVETVFRNS